jgi:hypothetical protein
MNVAAVAGLVGGPLFRYSGKSGKLEVSKVKDSRSAGTSGNPGIVPVAPPEGLLYPCVPTYSVDCSDRILARVVVVAVLVTLKILGDLYQACC